eukprot:jgi/Mesen1/4576/ME000232S03835
MGMHESVSREGEVTGLSLSAARLTRLHGEVPFREHGAGTSGASRESEGNEERSGRKQLIAKIAFGSCTSKLPDVPQPIWEHAIIPSNPHAWIWAGDMAYMDHPGVNCKEQGQHGHCSCAKDWLHSARHGCLAGNVSHARQRLLQQLLHPAYRKFVSHMCPGEDAAQGNPRGPMQGRDLAACKRPILGTWDDHDYNWQDGNRRLPTKERQKEVFLDALGVPSDSCRREHGRGIYSAHLLNEGEEGRQIQVILLDERFHRDPKPCHARRQLCAYLSKHPAKDMHAWCADFLGGGPRGEGSCCHADDDFWLGWCRRNGSRHHASWQVACDPASPRYGAKHVALDPLSHLPVEKELGSGGLGSGPFCEVLGWRQRQWLERQLAARDVALTLLVSPSPVFNNPLPYVCREGRKRRPAIECTCLDDFDCYPGAQASLLHAVAGSHGCAVVLTGDMHFSDIKVLRPGQQPFDALYPTRSLKRPIYQVMASGLTNDTAVPLACHHRVAGDPLGLRDHPECSFVSGPAFAIVEPPSCNRGGGIWRVVVAVD